MLNSAKRSAFLIVFGASAVSAAALGEPYLGTGFDLLKELPVFVIDHGGNSTGILFASSLVVLGWLRRGPSIGTAALLTSLGIVTGFGI